MSTLQLPATEEAVFTEDEDDEEYDERQNYEYQERNTEDYRSGDTEEYRNGDTEDYDDQTNEDYRNGDAKDYRNGDTEDYRNGDSEEYHGKYEEDDRQRQNNEDDDERPKDYDRLRTEYDPAQVTGGHETPPKVAGNIPTGEKDVAEPESQEVYRTICENLRHTLASIKSYSKVNMMGDAKASYFTIGKFSLVLTALSLLCYQWTRCCPAPGRSRGRR